MTELPQDDRAGLNVGGQASSEFSGADDDAIKLIQVYKADELKRVQARADKWVTGLGALVGVLTTAVVIKGPDTFTQLAKTRAFFVTTQAPKDVIIILMVLGGLALSLGIYFGYQAANGSPLQDNAIETLARSHLDVHGAAGKWRTAVRSEIASAQEALKHATQSTILGGVLLAAAILVTWTTPSAADSTETCVQSGSGIIRYDGALPTVVSGSVTIVACPEAP